MPHRRRIVRPQSLRPRGRWLAGLAALVALAGLIVAQSARADTVDGGTLVSGTTTTATFGAAGDVRTFAILVPTMTRLTFTVGDSAAPVDVQVSGFTPDGGGTGHPVSARTSVVGNSPGSARFEEFGTYPLDQHVTVTLTAKGPGVLPFTPTLFTDPAPAPIALNTPTTVTIGTAAELVTLTSPPVNGRLGVRVSSVTLSSGGASDPFTGQPYSLSTTPSSAERTPVSNEYLVMASTDPASPQPVTVKLGAPGGATGTLVVELFPVLDTTATLTPGTPLTVTLSSPLASARLSYTAKAGRRERIEVTAVALHHPDGSAGSVTLAKGAPGSLNPIGTVHDQPFTYEDANPSLLGGTARELAVTTDGATTGSLTIVVTTATEPPPITLAVGTSAVVTLGTPNQSQTLTLPVTAGQGYVLTVSDAAMTSAGGGAADVTYFSLQPPGSSGWLGGYYARSASLAPTATGLVFSYRATTSGDLTVLVNPLGDTVGHLTLTVTPLADVTVPLTNGKAATGSTAAPLQRLVYAFSGAPGSTVPAFRLTGVKLTANPGAVPVPSSLSATATLEQGGQVLTTYPTLTSTTTTADYPSTAVPGFDGTQPWQLVVTPAQNALATATVTASLPQLTVVPVTSGVRTTITFTAPTDRTRLTFTAPSGRRVLVRLQGDQVGATYVLRDADGRTYDSAPADDEWHPFAGEPTGPLVLEISSGGGTGTVAVTVLLVSDPTIAMTPGLPRVVSWTAEQNPRLTFDLPFGSNKRPVLLVTRTTGKGWTTIKPSLISSPTLPAEPMPVITAGRPSLSGYDTYLPQGTYPLVLDPQGSAAGSVTVTLLLVEDIQVNATVGHPVALRFTTPGQRAVVNVSLDHEQSLGWVVTGSTVPSTLRFGSITQADAPTFTVPRGSSKGTLSAAALPPSSYTLTVTPNGLDVGRLSLTLTTS